MKQVKFFAGAVALSLMASCASEEIQPNSPVAPSEDRPTTDFVFSVDDALFETTRSYFANAGDGFKWHFEVGDKIGAMLMDEWDGRGESIDNFKITDYAQSNIPVIKSEDGRWYVHEDVNPLAGNYFFYFPYEPVTTARGHFGFSVNPIQSQFNKEGKFDYWAAVEENQRYMGYSFAPVKEYDGQKINLGDLDFAPYFAMPAFEFLNKAGDLIVDKVVIRGTESLEANMYDKNKNQLIATTMALVPGDAGFDAHKKEWKNGDGDFTNETNLLWKYAMKYTSGGHLDETYQLPQNQGKSWTPGTKPFYALNKSFVDTYTDQAPAYEYVADYTGVEGGHIVKQFDYIRAILVMPAGDYDVDGFEAMIHVRPVSKPEDRYVVRIPLDLLEEGQFDDNQQTAGHNSLEPGKTSKFYGAFDATAMKSYDITKSQITSSEDLLWMVEEANKHTGDYKLTVNTSGKRVVLTKEIEEILTAKPNIHLYINGQITIGEGTTEDAINKLYYDNNSISTDLTILNKQVAQKTVANLSKLTVKKGGILNAGTVSVWSGEKDPMGYANLYNYGEIECTYLSACGVYNEGQIKVNKKKDTPIYDNHFYVQQNIENKGTIDVATEIRLVRNNAYINNHGNATLKSAAISQNGARPTYIVNIDNDGTLEVEGIVQANVNNDGTATVGTVTRTLTNQGTATVGTTQTFVNNGGTLNLTGSTQAITDGVNQNRIVDDKTYAGTINVNGAYSVTKLINKATTINVNADVKVIGVLTNNATINVAAGKSLFTEGNGVINNTMTINVQGKLVNQVFSNGVINVIENGLVIVEGILNEKAGIIDVTDASAATTSQAAKSVDTAMQFRYTVHGEMTAAALQESLKARISAHNYGTSPVILIWGANSAAEFKGTDLSGKSNVQYIIVNRDLTIVDDARFADLKSMVVNNTLTIGNGAESMGFNVGESIVTINGTVKANNHSVLAPETAKYTGAGTFYAANATVQWGAYNWTGKKY